MTKHIMVDEDRVRQRVEYMSRKLWGYTRGWTKPRTQKQIAAYLRRLK